jgi:hypothetical protein
MTNDDSIELKKAQCALGDAIGLLAELSRKDFDTETMNKCIAVKSFVYHAKGHIEVVQSRNKNPN